MQSGSLPARSKFYVHQKSAKAYSNSNYRGGGAHLRVDAGHGPPFADYLVYKPQHKFQGQPNMMIENEGEEETHQQIESVINMFPQPTAEQMEEFNELQ